MAIGKVEQSDGTMIRFDGEEFKMDVTVVNRAIPQHLPA